LRNSLQQAFKWNNIYRNPADLVDLPSQNKREKQALTPKQASKFMEVTVFSPKKAFYSLLLDSQ